MYRTAALLSATLLAGVLRPVRAQQVGTNTAEVHPKLTTQHCTTSGGCTTRSQSIVIDANWRWVHNITGYTNCYTGNTWDATLCPDPTTCAANCALEGADYSATYGITTSGNALTLDFVTKSSGTNIGSRVYLLDTDDTNYQEFDLLNQEFTFDVDVSNLPCGLNGALYFSEMQADGGLSEYSGNKAGSKYGTGYCDAQCPHDIKFIDGAANVINWTASANDVNAGSGKYGSCCSEMDIWEANEYATAFTPHPCSVNGPYECSGSDCGDGDERYDSVCDKDGCDFNPYRWGNTTFYGPSASDTIDTLQKFTVVTQFITNDGTATGTLTEIRRFYVQNGVTFANAYTNVAGIDSVNSITDAFCTQQKTVTGDTDEFEAKGGLAQMGTAFKTGMVLVMSLWDDHAANALWLDSDYPVASSPSAPGVARGPCSTSSGVPSEVEADVPGSSVTYSNIKYGDIGSTFNSTVIGGSGKSSSSSSTSKASSTSTKASSSSASSVKTSTTTSSAKASTTTSSVKTSTTTSSVKTTTTTPTSTVKTTTTTSSTKSSTSAATTGAAHYAQCGGTGWTGATTCASPYTCTVANAYYSQCL